MIRGERRPTRLLCAAALALVFVASACASTLGPDPVVETNGTTTSVFPVDPAAPAPDQGVAASADEAAAALGPPVLQGDAPAANVGPDGRPIVGEASPEDLDGDGVPDGNGQGDDGGDGAPGDGGADDPGSSNPPGGSSPNTTAPPQVTQGSGPMRYGSAGNGSADLGDCSVSASGGDLSGQVNRASSGSVICIAAGDYGSQILRITANGRTVKARGQVELGAIDIQADNVVVDGFRITSRSRTGADTAIEIDGANNRILNNYIAGAPLSEGIGCSGYYSCVNNTIAYNTVTGIHNIGIQISDRGNVVERNNVYGLARPTASGDVDALRFFGRDHLIRQNYFHDINEFQSARDSDGDTPHVDCFQTFTPLVGGQPLGTSDIVIEDNYCVRVSRQCLIASMHRSNDRIVRNITFRHNVCETYDSQVINIQGTENVRLENNYLGGEARYQVVALSKSGPNTNVEVRGFVARNNVIHRTSTRVADFIGYNNSSGHVIDGNKVVTGPTPIALSANFQENTGATQPAMVESDFTEFRQAAQAAGLGSAIPRS
ncbi:MAG: right-handed parallel beta-helix repeat-containing protein [Actinomycetota bacterium]